MYSFPATDPKATPVLTINMINRLPAGVTVASATVTAIPTNGPDPNYPNLVGTVDISGARLTPFPVRLQWKAGGIAGRIYLVTAVCLGSDGETYVGAGLMPIVAGGA
jgi:hypothetical protein